MNKLDLIKKISDNLIMEEKDVTDVLNELILIMNESFVNHEKIVLTGLGSFNIVERASRVAMNPQTREPIAIPNKLVVKFIPSTSIIIKLNKESK